MKKKLLSIVLAFVLAFSFCTTAFAALPDDGGTVSPQHTNSVSFSIDRSSATSAEVSAVVFFSTIVEDYSVVVYLQKLVNGTWEYDLDHDEYVIYNNGYGDNYCLFYNEYTNLERGSSYRVKVVSRDFIEGVQYREIFYSSSF